MSEKIDYLISKLLEAQDEVTHLNEKGREYKPETDQAIFERNLISAKILKRVTELETLFDTVSAKQQEIDALQNRVAELEADNADLIERLP